LAKRDATWRTTLAGCVTFGTPHEGATLAEVPGELLGWFVVVQTLVKEKSTASLTDILWYYGSRKNIEGIEDLRPLSGGGTFLRDLLEAELSQAPRGSERYLDILAIGGMASEEGLRWKLANSAHAGENHDLVVETGSTAPRLFADTLRVRCNHFSYFDGQPSQAGLDRAVKYLSERFERARDR
jgi:hypothetical protein